jgi:tetratricopeptide (TPR) repeat protein
MSQEVYMTRIAAVATVVILAVPVSIANSQTEPRKGDHSEHIGTVHFPTSCDSKVVTRFNRAVALLHSFEFGAAIRGFNDVLAADSTCAMAYWGLALSHWSNPMATGNKSVELLRQGQKSGMAARRLAANATGRERGYIEAVSKLYEDYEHRNQQTRVVAYQQAMRDLADRYPDDTEAKIFYAISLAASAEPTDKTYAKQLKAGSMLEKLWEAQPNHPGIAHYIIHSYDYPALAAKARTAARRYSVIAPSAAHALHMPSHTFTRAGMWEESINANKRSMAVALRTRSIGETLHAADYAMYAYLQTGKEAEARAILDSLPSLVSRFDVNAVTGAAPGSAGVFAIAAIPARWTLERHAWAEAAMLEPRASQFPHTEAMTYFARALGASHIGDLAKARASVDSLASIQQRLRANGEPYWAEQVAIQHLAAQAWLELASKKEDDALEHMREAATREDATEKSAVTPGPLAPARELLGDMLMRLNRREEAIAEYRRTLEKEPNRRHSLRQVASKNP